MSNSPFLRLLGAVEGVAPDAGVAAHYGEPLREQRALARGTAVVDASHLGVVRVAGPDRADWLTSLCTQVLTVGGHGESLILSPQGRIEHQFAFADDGECTWLITEHDGAAPLAEFLNRMRFMKQVEVTDLSGERFVFASMGAMAALDGISDAVVWNDPWTGIAAGGTQYAAIAPDEHPGTRYRMQFTIVSAEGRDRLLTAARAGELTMAGMLALEALRVAAWRPRFAREVDERALPHELDLLRSAVHLNKGCYRGQEAVAKVHNLGHPPRRLAFLDLDGMDGRLPAPGALVRDGDKPVGRVTSTVLHYDEGPIALALLKRNVDPQAALRVDLDLAAQVADGAVAESEAGAPEQVDAYQTVIVAPDAGDAAQMAELRRKFRGQR